MEAKVLKKSLQELGRKADEKFPKLNWGGCCVFAAAVATELEKLGVEHEVVVSGDKDRNINNLRPERNTINDWSFVGVCFGHVGIRLKLGKCWYTYDSEAMRRSKYSFGVRTFGNGHWTACEGGLTAKEATELADQHQWNSIFYNQKNVKAVRRLVKEHFRNVGGM